jgi:DNA-binding MarR family transcriptional regulator
MRRGSAKEPNTTQKLASFRYALRKFLGFSERAARGHGVTPQQHQLMLGVAGFTGTGRATVSELAEFLQERHHTVSELVARAVACGLVRKRNDTKDRRYVFVYLTPRGKGVLSKLEELHKQEIDRLRVDVLARGLRSSTSVAGPGSGNKSIQRKNARQRAVKQRSTDRPGEAKLHDGEE